jgi:quercetin 2,3-dioxygenase
MISVRRSLERGHANRGWLDSYHTFSFADYYDPAHMGFSVLRVINEDRVQSSQGFGTHGHRDMEIITYVLEGALKHQDSLGNGSVIRPGDVQRMSAGTGVQHSEFNASQEEPVHLLQIWILPRAQGLPPGYEQKYFPEAEKQGRWRLIVSPDGREGSLTIEQDAYVYAIVLQPGQQVTYRLAPGRKGYLHVARGNLQLNEQALSSGDSAKISDGEQVSVTSKSVAEALLFDLP